MSALKDQIIEDMKNAMRTRDKERLGTIRLLLSAIKQKEIDERVVLDDTAVVAIVDKLMKQRKDSIEAFQKAERKDLADKEAAELVVLQAYLPARLSAEEITATVKAGPFGNWVTRQRMRLRAGIENTSKVAICRWTLCVQDQSTRPNRKKLPSSTT